MGRTVCVADIPPCYADSMALLTTLDKKPVFTDAERPHLSLAHLTSVPLSRRNFSGALSAHRAFVKQTLSNHGVRWIRIETDIISLPAGDLGVLFGMQHAPDGMTEANMGEWRSARLQSIAPFSNANEYGGWIEDDHGLTERGRQLIGWMSRYGLILDLSNAGHRTAREALEFIRQEKLPTHLMASHTGCYEVFPRPRNLPDDVLRDIVRQGGYVGIPVISGLFLEEGDDPYAFVKKHVAHASMVCGADNVGIGSCMVADFVALGKNLGRKFSTPAVEGFLGRNFEYFLLRSLP